MSEQPAPVLTAAAADELAARLLGSLRTKLGGLHIAHARRVAAAVRDAQPADDTATVAALLHDVLEKTDVTVDELHALARDPGVVRLVDVLSHKQGETDETYLSRCARDPVALAIKRADLIDKLVADDTEVTVDVADRVRRAARHRLALLERLALRD